MTLREMLALDADVVLVMEPQEREHWRHRIDAAADEQAEEGVVRPRNPGVLSAAPSVAMALPSSLKLALAVDAERDDLGDEPLVTASATGELLDPLFIPSLFAPMEQAPIGVGFVLEDGTELDIANPAEAGPVLRAIASVIPSGTVVDLRFAPSAPLAVLYAGDDSTVYVNPAVVALSDDPRDLETLVADHAAGGLVANVPPTTVGATNAWGDENPYGFYSSIEECAAAETTRCNACMSGAGDCRSKLGSGDGASECATLSGTVDGFMLVCIMYALNMSTVDYCMDDTSPACVPNDITFGVSNLASFRLVLDTPGCLDALNACVEPYRDARVSCGCQNPCDTCVDNVCGPWLELGEACNNCSIACNNCSNSANNCSSSANSCSNSCNSCSDSCADSSCSCEVVSLPAAPVDPTAAPSGHGGVFAALRTAALLLLPMALFLWWRRRLPEVAP